MCGIAGIVRFDDQPISRDRLGAMLTHLWHRGPDGELTHAHDRCMLGQTRLSIIDLLHGTQSMHTPAAGQFGPLTIVFNGEIYNHRELRKRLEKFGHRFVSDHCDTEVLVHGYRQWGADLPKNLNGMFAFAIWDVDARRLFLCRDRTGQKPLYVYYRRPHGPLLFASLVGALCAGLDSDDTRPDTTALATYLRWGYSHQSSLIQGIDELPAAHWMSVEADGKTQIKPYWKPPPFSKSHSDLGAVEAVQTVLTDSVRRCVEADVPLGCWLSGGIDSSLIAALAQRELLQRGEGPLNTYSVKLPGMDRDESAYAFQVSKAIGSRHTELLSEENADVIDDLTRLIKVSGEPIADVSILPTYWMSKVVRKRAQVALSGVGGDELFGGYKRYQAMRLLGRRRWWPGAMPASVLANRSNLEPDKAKRRLRKVVDSANPQSQYHSIIHLFSDEQIQQLGLNGAGALEAAAEPAVPDWPAEADPVHAAMRWDLTHYLPFDLLRRIDRASMATALEVRCPMLDVQVCDLAAHLPPDVLMPHNRPKGLLRRFAATLLPKEIANRPKHSAKSPIGQWFRFSMKKSLGDLILGEQLSSIGIESKAVKRLFDEHVEERKDHTHRLFALLSLSLWSRWLESREPAAVFSP